MTVPRPRSPNGTNLHQFLAEFGVRVRPIHESTRLRPANVVYGGRTISRLMHQDIEQCRTVIASIKASNPRCFSESMVRSVWCFVDAHVADRPRQEVVAMFATIDIAEVSKLAQRLVAGRCGRMGKTTEKISTLLAIRLLEKDDAA